MARKITEKAVSAFMAGHNVSIGNTTVQTSGNTSEMSLFGNVIATRNGKTIKISTCGWATSTTKERLNGILDAMGASVRIYHHQRVIHLGDTPWGNHFTLTTVK